MERASMVDLSKIGERERLRAKAGDEPHWQRLRAGCFVGYRPSKRGGKGTWFARAYDTDESKYQRKALGDYGTASGNEVFGQAKRDSEAWADRVESGGVQKVKMDTVEDACCAYLRSKPEDKIAEGVFRRHVLADPLAKVKLDKLRRHHLSEWRKRLEDAPAVISRNKKGEKRTKARALSTVNRDMVPLRAALSRVLSPGAPGTDAAWQEALKAVSRADGQRKLRLNRSERQRLLAAVSAEAAPFVRALCILPLRPGALAALVAGDYDGRTRTLAIGKDKSGKARQITVPVVIGDFLAEQIKGKLPAAPMFMRSNGEAWDRNTWGDAIGEAAKAAHLPSGTVAYTLRHSTITELVTNGLPLLTIAQLSGTSVAMIERHYGHLARKEAEEALARLAL